MAAPLDETVALLHTAEHKSARTCSLQWPQMIALVQAARALSRAAEQDPMSVRELEALDLAWAFVRCCAEGPVTPKGEAAELDEALTAAAGLASAHRQALEQIRTAAAEVTGGDHPAASWLVDLLTSHEPQELPPLHPRAGQPAVSLLVRPRAAGVLRRWIEDEQLYVDLTTPAEARSATPWDCMVVFGPPARYTANQWTRGPAATMRSAWLLNAPPARETVIATWPGHAPIDVNGLAPWSAGPQPRIQQDAVLPDVDFVWQSQEAAPALQRAVRHSGPDAVPAAGVQVLVDEGTTVQAYFSTTIGPAPAVASTDQVGLAVRSGAVGALRPGTHLLFRLGGTEAAALNRATEQWCHDNRPGTWPEKARRYQGQLKSNLEDWLDATGYDPLVRQLVSAGLPRDYSQHLPARVLHPLYIAPHKREYFDALCRAVGYAAPADSFTTLTHWRTARQQGGLIVRTRLLAVLGGAAQEAAELDDVGYTRLDHPELGEVLIGTVLAPLAEPGHIQVSRLGKPLTETGALWQQ